MTAVGQGSLRRCAIYTRKSTEEGLDQVSTLSMRSGRRAKPM